MTAKKSKPSEKFLEEKELREMELSNMKEKHKMKMEELKMIRETNRLNHEWELERGRIRTAEIRRTIYQKEALRHGKKESF